MCYSTNTKKKNATRFREGKHSSLTQRSLEFVRIVPVAGTVSLIVTHTIICNPFID